MRRTIREFYIDQRAADTDNNPRVLRVRARCRIDSSSFSIGGTLIHEFETWSLSCSYHKRTWLRQHGSTVMDAGTEGRMVLKTGELRHTLSQVLRTGSNSSRNRGFQRLGRANSGRTISTGHGASRTTFSAMLSIRHRNNA